MSSIRQQKVARLLQRDLSEIFLKLRNTHLEGCMVSVTMVRISPDLSYAKIYCSLFGSALPQHYLECIQANKNIVRKELGIRVKKQLRIVPELDFYIDDSIEYASKIDELLKK
ncbi:Ribosome-binding factor A [Flavobacteriales bacterium]|nr:Ribosome-binding factor A [Flavobacteriales bacterium]MCL4815342.1 30S ribosome-binding factor RbfA [Flavobacteriales bacterium]WKZ74961.1 MAG: 30S ribosome-binding factor RbfA [Vicingaceae bacterium]CAG0960765.1 Ribosome-binding factor A [Flavobacteriales bacterium]